MRRDCLKRGLLVGCFSLALLWTVAPLLHASGDWLTGGPVLTDDDLSSYDAATGVITALNLRNKPPLIQFTSEEGEVLILVIPKAALVSINGKLINVKRLRVGQRATLRWTVKDDLRVVGTLDVLPEEQPEEKSIIDLKGLKLPAVPRPNLTRPLSVPPQLPMAQPAAVPFLRESAPVSSPLPPRPVIPVAPSLNQDLRR